MARTARRTKKDTSYRGLEIDDLHSNVSRTFDRTPEGYGEAYDMILDLRARGLTPTGTGVWEVENFTATALWVRDMSHKKNFYFPTTDDGFVAAYNKLAALCASGNTVCGDLEKIRARFEDTTNW